MKKIVVKIAEKISQKPILSVISAFVLAVIVTSIVVLSTNLKTAFVSDGIYAIRSHQVIELKGDAELPLYCEALENLGKIPGGLKLDIQSGFGKYVPGTQMCDLVYYNGKYTGDFFQTSVILMGEKDGHNYYERQNYSAQYVTQPSDQFNLNDRKNMIMMASLQVNEKMGL